MRGMQGELHQPVEARREERIQVDLNGAQLREPGYRSAPVKVRDLSLSGFRTEWPYRLQKDDLLWLSLPGLQPRSARVAWTKDFEVGCRFEEALHPAVLERVVRACAAA